MIVVTGHYGSGKTNLSVNLAMDLRAQGEKVVVVDLDIVNPYFRTADFVELFGSQGIEVINPEFANTNLDLPVVNPKIYSAFNQPDSYVIFDVGGDDDGAIALGQYAHLFSQHAYSMLYVVNRYRHVDPDVEEAVGLLRRIEASSRLKVTGIINNSHLSEETGPETVLESIRYAKEISSLSGVPLLGTAVKEDVAQALSGQVEHLYPVKRYVKTLWEK
ncbi:MAG TPA: ParA family protein [Firmicutes bacterium]|nr:ParA family protein [Bacillota bacterium]